MAIETIVLIIPFTIVLFLIISLICIGVFPIGFFCVLSAQQISIIDPHAGILQDGVEYACPFFALYLFSLLRRCHEPRGTRHGRKGVGVGAKVQARKGSDAIRRAILGTAALPAQIDQPHRFVCAFGTNTGAGTGNMSGICRRGSHRRSTSSQHRDGPTVRAHSTEQNHICAVMAVAPLSCAAIARHQTSSQNPIDSRRSSIVGLIFSPSAFQFRQGLDVPIAPTRSTCCGQHSSFPPLQLETSGADSSSVGANCRYYAAKNKKEVPRGKGSELVRISSGVVVGIAPGVGIVIIICQ
mmetsp:Transcript_13116/g.37389  ORF Transcript_13116/g.37389 Transcript_13116/m.37389 type:complete len:297 (+) Transcript_13116:455-1345(+)